MVVINNKEIIDIFKRLAAYIRYNEYVYLVYNDDFIDLLKRDELIKLASEWADAMKQDKNDNKFTIGWKPSSSPSVEDAFRDVDTAIRIMQANGFDVLKY